MAKTSKRRLRRDRALHGRPYAEVLYRHKVFVEEHMKRIAREVYGTEFAELTGYNLQTHKTRWKYSNRKFSSYEEAMTHVTSVKLGLEKDHNGWENKEPIQITKGRYTSRGLKRTAEVVPLVADAIKQFQKDQHVRPCVRRELAFIRQPSVQRADLVPLPKDMDRGPPKPSQAWLSPYDPSGRYRSFNRRVKATRVGRRTNGPYQISS